MRAYSLSLLFCACSGAAPSVAPSVAPTATDVAPAAEVAEEESAQAEAPDEEAADEAAMAALDAEYDAALEEDAEVEEAEQQQRLEAFRAVVLPLDASLADRAAEWMDREGFGAGMDDFSVRERRGMTVVSFFESGHGIEATWSETRTVFRAGRRVLEVERRGSNQRYTDTLELDRSIATARSALEAAFDTTILRVPRQPLYGLARLFTSVSPRPAARAGAGFSVVGPLYGHRPRPATFPLPTQNGRTTGQMLLERGSRIMRVAPVHADCPATQVGAHTLRQCQLVGPNTGVAVALMDSESEGRWVLETRSAMLGSSIDWAGEHGGYLFGHYTSSHPGGRFRGSAGLVALRTSNGAVYRVDVTGAYENGREVENASEEQRRAQESRACLETTAAMYGVEVRVLPPADHRRCSPAPWNTFSMDEGALVVGRPDGNVVRIPIASVLQAIR